MMTEKIAATYLGRLLRASTHSRTVKISMLISLVFVGASVGTAMLAGTGTAMVILITVAAGSLGCLAILISITLHFLRMERAETQRSVEEFGPAIVGRVDQAAKRIEADVTDLRKSTSSIAKETGELHKKADSLAAKAVSDVSLAELESRMNRTIQIETRNMRVQTEALLSVFHTLSPSFPLPPSGDWAMDADLLSFLVEQVLFRKPNRLVEFGSGTSTVLMGMCLKKLGSGSIISFDHDAEYAAKTRAMLADRDLTDFVTVVTAPLDDLTIDDEHFRFYQIPPEVDLSETEMVVVDGPPGPTCPMARFPAFPIMKEHLAPTWIVVLDDAKRPEEQTSAERWQASFSGSRLTILPHHKGTAVLESP